MALTSRLESERSTGGAGEGGEETSLPAAVGCQLCGGPEAALPHLNCANLDCARLFIACAACKVFIVSCSWALSAVETACKTWLHRLCCRPHAKCSRMLTHCCSCGMSNALCGNL